MPGPEIPCSEAVLLFEIAHEMAEIGRANLKCDLLYGKPSASQ
jgi:hypothetical protein